VVEERSVSLAPIKIHVSNLEVVINCCVGIVPQSAAVPSFAWREGRTHAKVIIVTAIVRHETHRIVRRDVFGVLGHEICTGDMSARVDEGKEVAGVPFTVNHRLSIVRRVSKAAIVKPKLSRFKLGQPESKG
jgi:hypothetical protein